MCKNQSEQVIWDTESTLVFYTSEEVKCDNSYINHCDSWSADNLIADEFSAEIADGVAYVSGYDDNSRPVLVHSLPSPYIFLVHNIVSNTRKTSKDSNSWPPCQREL